MTLTGSPSAAPRSRSSSGRTCRAAGPMEVRFSTSRPDSSTLYSRGSDRSRSKCAARVRCKRSSLSGSASSSPTPRRSSPRCAPVGVTTTRAPPGRRTRWNSAPLRSAKTFSTVSMPPSTTGKGFHTSQLAAPARGCARAARRSAYGEASSPSPVAPGSASRARRRAPGALPLPSPRTRVRPAALPGLRVFLAASVARVSEAHPGLFLTHRRGPGCGLRPYPGYGFFSHRGAGSSDGRDRLRSSRSGHGAISA